MLRWSRRACAFADPHDRVCLYPGCGTAYARKRSGCGRAECYGHSRFLGMLVATALGVFLIPGNFAFVEGLGRKRKTARGRFRPCHHTRRRTEMKQPAFVAVVTLLVAGCVAGCMVGPDYGRLQFLIPSNYRSPSHPPQLNPSPTFPGGRFSEIQYCKNSSARRYRITMTCACCTRVEEARGTRHRQIVPVSQINYSAPRCATGLRESVTRHSLRRDRNFKKHTLRFGLAWSSMSL